MACMYPYVNYNWRPEGGRPTGVTIDPSGDPAGTDADGDINLFPQASRLFGMLGQSNTFVGPTNTFQDVVARRVHVTSDATQKQEAQPLSDADAERLVRNLVPYRYVIDGRPAAGVLAQDVPASYTRRLSDGTLTVDYTSLLAELWGAVRHLSQRVDDLTGSGSVGRAVP